MCVPTICSPISKQNIKSAQEKYNHLSNLELADYSDCQSDSNIHILIGVDFYYSFISGKVRRGESGPVALESCLGWVSPVVVVTRLLSLHIVMKHILCDAMLSALGTKVTTNCEMS